MDQASQQAVKLLTAWATIREQFSQLSFQLQKREDVASVKIIFDCRKFQYNRFPDIGIGIGAEFKNGTAMDWTLELMWDEEWWYIDYNISETKDRYGPHTIVDYPILTTQFFDEVIEHLFYASNELQNAAKSAEVPEA